MKRVSVIQNIHNWITLCIMIPLFILTITALVLMMKEQSNCVQSSTVRGGETTPTVLFETILDSVKAASGGSVTTWDDINRIDVRPSKGVAKVQLEDLREIQIDLATGEVLQAAVRCSDCIEDIHTGGYFGYRVKFGVLFVVVLLMFIQIITGIYLWLRVIVKNAQKRRLVVEEIASVE